ncbi:SET domain-containing protein-lysine N-methyltransferase [Pseudomonas sp. PCH199]|uniref:SET domain-containing protein-lysine N-methyltransferase n=1 Tax=unclassified Pseudomonas TaxID=196821 RepID=UPI000BDB5AD4|nr:MULTISPECIES: SET domain-containing protein-lysine N-methyltransferase [unclassified Pseudomonas]MCW8275742.1 SET domain-containing protein-lysine N-methyltransferase [Pseudomonas sp. PCH199]PAM83823.1 lysine methyltransferase [Pseudomonas sp. ERMR1:02]
MSRSLAAPPAGVYPSARLSLHLGFPSLADFEIHTSDTGKPVAAVALREFPRISRICRVSGHLLPYRCRNTRQLAPGVHVYDPRFCGLLRHSCDPNVFLDMSELWLWALKDIQKGDWLTMDYAATEDKLLRQFACRCGSYNCRGWIHGYEETPNADGQQFLQHWRRL